MLNTKCLSKYTRNGICKIKSENKDTMFALYVTLSACSEAKIVQEQDKIVVKNDISTVNEIYKNFNKETKTAVIILKTSKNEFYFTMDIPAEYHEKVAKFMFKMYDDINPTEVYLISDDMGYSYAPLTNEHGTFMSKHGLKDREIISLFEINKMTIQCLEALKSFKWVMCCIECGNEIKNDTSKNSEKKTFVYTLKDFNENKVIISDDNILKAYDYRGHRIAYSNCVGTLGQYVSVCVDGITISTRTKHCNALRYAIEYLNKNNIKPVEIASEQPDSEPFSEKKTSPLEIPFDMRIKHLCRICNHLEECFYSERSKVLEYYANHEYCGDVCGECTLCCSKFESIHIDTIQLPESYDDGDLPF